MGVTEDGGVADLTKDEVIAYGLELLEGVRPEGHATEAYEDLCLGLATPQIKQVNELVRLILASREGG